MVNFGPRETVPVAFDDRTLYVHNDQITLMRTTPEECTALGREVAATLRAATGPTALFVPLRGVSMIAVEGGPFHDAAADEALFAAVREGAGPNVEPIDLDVNDPAFSQAMADWLEARLREAGAGTAPRPSSASTRQAPRATRSSGPARARACRRSAPSSAASI
jgi:uncharacterized protein (UPF0261 family)